jgi:hypothetical protein
MATRSRQKCYESVSFIGRIRSNWKPRIWNVFWRSIRATWGSTEVLRTIFCSQNLVQFGTCQRVGVDRAINGFTASNTRSAFGPGTPPRHLGLARPMGAGARRPGLRGSVGRGAVAICTGGLSSRTFRSDARKRAAGRDTTNLPRCLARGMSGKAYIARRSSNPKAPRRDCRAGAAHRNR